jgi:hypothetical protein
LREEIVQLAQVGRTQPIGQLFVDQVIGMRDCLPTNAFNRIQVMQQDRSRSQHFDQAGCEHDAFVLPLRAFDQFLEREPVMIRLERFEAEDCLKYSQVLSPSLHAATVLCPCLDRNPKLIGRKVKQRSERHRLDAEDTAGKAEIAERDRKAQPATTRRGVAG